MRTITFVCEEHEDFGDYGWRLKDRPDFDPLGAMAVAHDTLEHFEGDDGDISGECEAMGCMMWIRGIGGYWNPKTDPGELLGSTIIMELFDSWHFKEYPFNNKWNGEIPECENYDIGLWIDFACNHALEIAKTELEFNFENDETLEEVVKKFVKDAKPWLIHDANKAIEKYIDPCEAAAGFMTIEKEAGEAIEYADEGDEIHITYDEENLYDVECQHFSYFEIEAEEELVEESV